MRDLAGIKRLNDEWIDQERARAKLRQQGRLSPLTGTRVGPERATGRYCPLVDAVRRSVRLVPASRIGIA